MFRSLVVFEQDPDRKFQVHTGVDGMITIFCDFRQFSAEKIGVFSQKPLL
jgi:hypothetical protein